MSISEGPVVIMADDDDDDCMLARAAFEESGARGVLLCIENGLELMDYLSRCIPLPALIFLDLNMPVKDGREVLREIKETPAIEGIPVVVLTTSQEERDVIYCSKWGAKSFITKPSSFSGWVEIMRQQAAERLNEDNNFNEGETFGRG